MVTDGRRDGPGRSAGGPRRRGLDRGKVTGEADGRIDIIVGDKQRQIAPESLRGSPSTATMAPAYPGADALGIETGRPKDALEELRARCEAHEKEIGILKDLLLGSDAKNAPLVLIQKDCFKTIEDSREFLNKAYDEFEKRAPKAYMDPSGVSRVSTISPGS